MRRTRRNRGSIVLLVVGLLTIIAMLGSTFVFVSRMDRRQSKAIAESAPIDGVADDILRRILEDRLADLHISNQNMVYGDATTVSDHIDAIHEKCDRILASPERVGGRWAQVSNLGNLSASQVKNVASTNLADTDGDGIGDAILWDTGISNGAGSSYWVAIRVLDLSGMVNVNTAYLTSVSAERDHVLPLHNISLRNLIGDPAYRTVHISRRGTTRREILDYEDEYNIRTLDPKPLPGRYYLPFDMSDMVALAWRRNNAPTTLGRLFREVGNTYNNASPHLTVMSTSRILVPAPVTGETAQVYKADLNRDDYGKLFNAFYNAIPMKASGFVSGMSDAERTRSRKLLAAQMAVNVIDFTDEGDEVTYRDKDSSGNSLQSAAGGEAVAVFGIERQPFVTEAFGKWYREVPEEEGQPAEDRYYYAVELLNPYTTTIDLGDYKIADQKLSGAIKPGGRVVIVSDKGSIVVSTDGAPTVVEIANLDLKGGATITRKVGSHEVIMGKVPPITLPQPKDNDRTTKNLIWPDVLKKAQYTMDIPPQELTNKFTHDYTNKDLGTMTGGNSKLGTTNPDAPVGNQEPCPVYVRNGMMISLGDLCRIFHVGPSTTKSLREQLGAGGGISVGRMDPAGNPGTYGDQLTADIPVGALLANYVMVGSPLADLDSGGDAIDNDGDGSANDLSKVGREDTVAGLININTGTGSALMCIGGVGELPVGERQNIANRIINYRESREAVGGFASPAELAIPLHLGNPVNNYAQTAPLNYALGSNGGDDGLRITGADKVEGDLIKSRVHYSWASNSVTVRSDVYLAYIRVQAGADEDATQGVRNYVAVIDRGNCRRRTDRPIVHMCTRVK